MKAISVNTRRSTANTRNDTNISFDYDNTVEYHSASQKDQIALCRNEMQ